MTGSPRFHLILLSLLLPGFMEVWAVEPLTIRSRTGQFVVRGVPTPLTVAMPGPILSRPPRITGDRVQLDPTVLAVSCERIRTTLLELLELPDSWKGKIYLNLHEADDDDRVRLVSISYADSWSYRLELPDEIEPDRLTRTVAEVLLREIANRGGVGREAEIPAWLREGIVGHMQSVAGRDFVLTPDTLVLRKARGTDSVGRVRKMLREEEPLSIERLSWPTAEDWVDGGSIYRGSAHLLVAELLNLEDGPRCMANLLALLPRYLNWQLAFLHAYGAHFDSMIAFEKWWSVSTVSYSSRGQLFRWDGRTTLTRLDEILSIPVEVRLSNSELPLDSVATLQQVIREWDYSQQVPVLAQKMNYLQVLALRSPVDYIGLVRDYGGVLGEYMARRNGVDKAPRRLQPGELARVISNALTRLDELDKRRRMLGRLLVPAEQAQN